MSSLTTATIANIETRSEDALRGVYGDLSNITLPVDPTKVASQYGLSVYASRFTDDSISGLYDRDKKEIHVAQDEYLPRQLFTMAHELGHFFLHPQKQETFYRQQALMFGDKPKDETEADWFASALLMPEDILAQYWDITNDIEKLADTFVVSMSAIRWRLHNLGLKKYATDTPITH